MGIRKNKNKISFERWIIVCMQDGRFDTNPFYDMRSIRMTTSNPFHQFVSTRGDCGSCTVSVGGSRIKACVGKVPAEPRLKSLQEKGLEVK